MTHPAHPASTVRRTPLYGLLTGNAISLVGSAVSAIAIPWYVLETTGSAARVGIVAFMVVLPHAISGILGGALVDRVGFKRMSIAADLLSGACIAAIPALADTVGIAFWQLLTLVFFAELLTVPGLTARRSLLPEIAALGRVRLERVNSSFEGVFQISALLGPPVAGLVIATIGARNALWIDAASFLVSAVMVAIAVPGMTRTVAAAGERYLDQVRAGLRYLREDRLLTTLAVGVGLSNAVSSPAYAVLLPIYAKETWGDASRLGMVLAAGGAGSLAGAAMFGAFGFRLPRRTVWVLGFLAMPLGVWALASQPSPAVLAAAFFVSGLFGGPLNPLMVTIRHERIPVALRGRVFAAFSAMATLASPLGMLAGGALSARLSVRDAAIILAVGGTILGVAMLLMPSLRALNAPSPAHPDPAESTPVSSAAN